MKKIFFDAELTGLHKDTTLISIGFIADTGETFYAELNDYDNTQISDWVRENVIRNLVYQPPLKDEEEYWTWDKKNNVRMRGDKQEVRRCLTDWFQALLGGPISWIDYKGTKHSTLIEEPLIEIWGDHLSYDWVLLNDLWGSSGMLLPKCLYYIPFDICTCLKLKGLDLNIYREEHAEMHFTALHDAEGIKACYKKCEVKE